MRFAGEEELAARGLGDGCGDLMFFSSVLDFFIYYGSLVVSYRLVPRLVRASSVASRPFFLPSHCLLVSFSSRPVERLVGHLVPHLVLSPCCLAHRLIVPSCRGVLLARLVFFSFVLSPSPCGFRYGVPAWVSCYRIIPMGVRLAPLRLAARSLLARYETVVRCPCPSCVIRA